ncbi:MAG: aldehyde dehydrogenase family protein [Daejeonella sp.]|uniref:aldehyde dehydrogenase family protein n=1 Tax=Daejeonella sp. TaxID=2805397 RepID=UPI002732F5F1|nr:aldehyde dehydrogenase family protein [Daejeonella sp.]MDP3468056.1 aldehyde dehydrogenase family protein [Daejeonella sp.]
MQKSINEIFELQKVHSILLRSTGAAERKEKLRKLKMIIQENEGLIFEALQIDLRKSEFEAALTEVYFVYAEIDFAIKNLSSWLNPRKVAAGLSSFFTKNRIFYEPKGVSLIISPWNYPFQLLIAPLVSAIAAGNCAMLKPSELSPATTSVLLKLINDSFDSKEIACFEGGVEVSEALLELPFDHIFFTGSPKIGKVIMAAAARHLSSVTLELGGKSPALIAEDADLQKAAEKIVWGKFMNSGQTCIAPDYVFIHASKEQEFLRLASLKIAQLFYNNDVLDKSSYGKIISTGHYQRLKALRDKAVDDGAQIIKGGTDSDEDQTIEPVLLSKVSVSSAIMQEEIFGPLLPVITYESISKAIDFINQMPKPLALYIFSGSDAIVRNTIKQTSAGGTCVNDVVIHISNPNLPFGGIGNSGSGSCHGFFGFRAFSHERAVMFQSKIDFSKIAYPPYPKKQSLLKWLKKIM